MNRKIIQMAAVSSDAEEMILLSIILSIAHHSLIPSFQ